MFTDINSYFLCVTIPKYYLPVAVEKWKFQFTVNNFHESDYLSSFIIDNLYNKSRSLSIRITNERNN